MFSFLRKPRAPIRSVTIPLIGTLFSQPGTNALFGRVDTITPNNEVELSVDPVNGTELSEEQIRLLQELPNDYNYYMEMLCTYLEVAFEEFSLETIKQMYFLAAIELKKYNSEWHFTLEPGPNVPSVYDHFQRFTIVNKMITWSNVSLD